MRSAAATAITSAPELALIVRVPASQLASAVPVPLVALDSFAEAEPSRGSTIKLASGRHVVVIYGEVTERLSLHVPANEAEDAIEDFLSEARLDETSVIWRRPVRSPLRA